MPTCSKVIDINIMVIAISCALSLPTMSSAQTQSSLDIWYVYHDAVIAENDKAHEGHGVWTNVMPETCGKENRTTITEDHRDTPQSDKSSVKIDFVYPPVERWCGIAVSSKENYWGELPGPYFSLEKYKHLVFWARGHTGGEVVQIKMGITGDKPYGDRTKSAVSTKRIELENQWHKYTLDLNLDQQSLTRIITPFAVFSSQSYNPYKSGVTFYLDEIYYK